MTDHARTTVHDRARPRTTAHDRPRTTTHYRARPRTTMHDHARPRTTTHDHAWPTTHARTTAHDRARPRTTAHDRAQPTTAAIFVWGSGTHPTPGGFRGLNCLARLALARERTPSQLKLSYSQPLTFWMLPQKERGSSVVERRIRNQVSPGLNPSLVLFRRLGIFVLSIDAPVVSAV